MQLRRLTTMAGLSMVAVLAACEATPEVAEDPEAPEVAEEPEAPEDALEEPEDAPEQPEDVDEEPADDPQPVVEEVAEGFYQPWGLAFIGDGPQLLVTEIGGTLSMVDTDTGEVTRVDGVPEVTAEGQGGLLDVTVGPDAESVYLTYSHRGDDEATSTHLARGQLDVEGAQLVDLEVLFVVDPFLDPDNDHYGSRVLIGPDGYLYLTTGDREDKTFDETHVSQDTTNHLGTIVRLELDGSVPDDNPFVDDPDVLDEIFTYGHRNVQGITVHPDTDEIWVSDHGEEDGDELHVLEAGGNYGWPLAHTGCEYGTEIPIGDHPDDRDEFVSPVLYWECTSGGFPPAGMTFYDGEQFPQWQGDLLVTGLFTEDLARFTVDGDTVEEIERLVDDQGWRLRDVEVGPHDGAIYLAIDDNEVPLVRLVADQTDG